MTSVAVLGYGYWGPNIVRNFSRLTNARVSWVCDLNPKTLLEIPQIYPTIQTTQDPKRIFTDSTVDAVVIVTPTISHFSLAQKALLSGKHVLVEKPITSTAAEAAKLVKLARVKKRTLMVDHTFIYTPAIQKLRTIIQAKILGDITSIDCVRTNLGLLQKDSNVIYDLAVHDFSIIDYLLGASPKTIFATGVTQKQLAQETVSYITAKYKNNLLVHSHVSWLSPIKIRRMIFVGTKKMLIYDDIEPTEKIKIYDKGISLVKDPKQSYQLRVGYRNGEITIPAIPVEEGLYGMAREFIQAIQNKRTAATDGSMGMRVVKCLEAATKSQRSGGKQFTIHL
jgi:predicted dehydrogenase